MRRTMLVLAIALTSCGGTVTTTTTAGPSLPTSTSIPTTTTTLPPPGCPQDVEFASTGRIARVTQPSSDSRVLGLISVQESEGCERIGFDFETNENAPSTTPPSATAEFLPGERIIRIRLDIERTVITDQIVESALIDRLYVVRSLEGGLFVDLHLASPTAAQMTLASSPASLTLELTSRLDGELATPALISERTVLLTPENAETVQPGPVLVTGYSRTFEANVLVVASMGNDVVTQINTQAADWAETWGEFETELELTSGDVDLFVGEASPEDGSLEGVTLKLEVR